ncbi:HPP family protein [Bacillus solitudinis]|uniref:HPP family protein n=1 Tax=Bacillus solitudinis TaxID=2014074 RepID=UPI000C24A295|nr:HPP family protein [Bacillus solitudinis]
MNIEKVNIKEIKQEKTLLYTYLLKMKGKKGLKSSVNFADNVVSATGGLIAISIISFVAVAFGYPMVLGPIGASCLLVFVAHAGPFSQPRHVLGGHILSTLAALTIWEVFGRTHLTIGMTLAVVVFLMLIFNTVHPPAAASAIVAINSQVGWGFLVTVIACSILVVFLSIIYNNLFKNRQYPKQWV